MTGGTECRPKSTLAVDRTCYKLIKTRSALIARMNTLGRPQLKFVSMIDGKHQTCAFFFVGLVFVVVIVVVFVLTVAISVSYISNQ